MQYCSRELRYWRYTADVSNSTAEVSYSSAGSTADVSWSTSSTADVSYKRQSQRQYVRLLYTCLSVLLEWRVLGNDWDAAEARYLGRCPQLVLEQMEASAQLAAAEPEADDAPIE